MNPIVETLFDLKPDYKLDYHALRILNSIDKFKYVGFIKTSRRIGMDTILENFCHECFFKKIPFKIIYKGSLKQMKYKYRWNMEEINQLRGKVLKGYIIIPNAEKFEYDDFQILKMSINLKEIIGTISVFNYGLNDTDKLKKIENFKLNQKYIEI